MDASLQPKKPKKTAWNYHHFLESSEEPTKEITRKELESAMTAFLDKGGKIQRSKQMPDQIKVAHYKANRESVTLIEQLLSG